MMCLEIHTVFPTKTLQKFQYYDQFVRLLNAKDVAIVWGDSLIDFIKTVVTKDHSDSFCLRIREPVLTAKFSPAHDILCTLISKNKIKVRKMALDQDTAFFSDCSMVEWDKTIELRNKNSEITDLELSPCNRYLILRMMKGNKPKELAIQMTDVANKQNLDTYKAFRKRTKQTATDASME